VSCAPGPVGAPSTLQTTAQMAADQLERLADPVAGPLWRGQLAKVALERLGTPGGTARMVAAIMAKLEPLSHPPHGTRLR
ncbi:MAG: hypothetical protein ACKOYH_04755, partial [Cyanobium sp.]